jgi:hypothetical protein
MPSQTRDPPIPDLAHAPSIHEISLMWPSGMFAIVSYAVLVRCLLHHENSVSKERSDMRDANAQLRTTTKWFAWPRRKWALTKVMQTWAGPEQSGAFGRQRGDHLTTGPCKWLMGGKRLLGTRCSRRPGVDCDGFSELMGDASRSSRVQLKIRTRRWPRGRRLIGMGIGWKRPTYRFP